ncbi:hypothetical protein [Bacillus sp. JCM 19034]|uniref:hypothetical protein n=1 Tax=Bacillus sp. JCM 19034 TaxID=1481928 RepID=UPI000782F9F9|nr:hypothetical protein [Bacillus sp. JCM 19034]
MLVLAIVLFLMNMFLAAYLGILYGSILIKKTGMFATHSTMAAIVHIVLSVITIISWYIFASSISWFVVIGGIVLGSIFFIIGEIVLFLFLYENKDKYIEIYKNDIKEEEYTITRVNA